MRRDEEDRAARALPLLSAQQPVQAPPAADGGKPGGPSLERRTPSFWLHELSYSSLGSSDEGYTNQPWLPDELCANCMHCGQEFGIFTRISLDLQCLDRSEIKQLPR